MTFILFLRHILPFLLVLRLSNIILGDNILVEMADDLSLSWQKSCFVEQPGDSIHSNHVLDVLLSSQPALRNLKLFVAIKHALTAALFPKAALETAAQRL